jgi:hypothetical protein
VRSLDLYDTYKAALLLPVSPSNFFATRGDRDGMIRDAIEHLTSAGRAAAGRRNGQKSAGRPAMKFDDAVTEQARIAWFDLRHGTNAAAIRAGPAGWVQTRYYRVFGPSGRGSCAGSKG